MKETISTEIGELVNQFPGIFFWSEDNEGNNFLQIENLAELTGYTTSEIKKLRSGWRSLLVDEDVKIVRKSLEEAESDSNKDFIEFEYRITKKNGEIIHLAEKIQFVRDDDGNVLKKFGVVIDITEYKVTIEKLKEKSNQLKLNNAAKDNFISILSHDLRAPFTSILGFSEIILNETSLPEKDKAEYVKFIYDSSNNQLQLVNHLFDWSQIQTERVKFEIQRLHAQSIAYNCVSYLTGLAIRKNISINVKIPDSIYIDADEKFVTKVFTNLISNGVKYSFENGAVEVIGNIYNGKFFEFIVKDKGVGISEFNHDRIFNIAKLFSTEGTKGEKGSGLGLTLSKQIVEKHGGELWFYSKEGKGSEFHFTLPAATSYVLLVFNDNNKFKDIEKELKKNFPNLEILKTENAFEALEITSDKSPSLIIIEHKLPLMDGLQLVAAVREKQRHMKIPFIVYVDSDSEDLIKSYQEVDVKILKQKQSATDSLKDKVDMLLYS